MELDTYIQNVIWQYLFLYRIEQTCTLELEELVENYIEKQLGSHPNYRDIAAVIFDFLSTHDWIKMVHDRKYGKDFKKQLNG